MKLKRLFCLFAMLALWAARPAAHAADLTHGLMVALPTPGGKAPVIDGSLDDWDLSAVEPLWISPETATKFSAKVALMYDAEAIYVGATIRLPDRALKNPNSPVDAFWWGDLLEFRLTADPALPAPLQPTDPKVIASNRVVHCSLWKNSQTGIDYLHIAYGIKLDKGKVVNPPGAKVVIKPGASEYVVEAKIPWAALNVPGGKNPFKPGDTMTAIWGVHWGGEQQTSALYRSNPGAFAFQRAQTWGQVQFSATGNIPPRHATMEAALAAEKRSVGVPITFNVPTSMKVSVNIFGPKGEVLREIIGGEKLLEGKNTVYWDGRDQWGSALPPGTYRWGAYLSPGLKAEYIGGVGTSGNPPYETEDGRGGWGADHGAAIAVAADSSGMYFLWTGAEAGRTLVKTDYAGNVIWRKTPFVGGGFGPHYAIASNGKTVFLTFGADKPQLLRLDATTGQLLTFPNGAALTPISDTSAVKVTEDSSPIGTQPETVGLACSDKEVFASVYSKNLIRVFDVETGIPLREFACPGPRGLAMGAKGELYAVSYAQGQAPRILVFAEAKGEPTSLITGDLDAPWGVAVDPIGRLFVTDNGKSQQVKLFNQEGRLYATIGRPGGRGWAGTYDGTSLLKPAGIVADRQGGFLIAEASPPKVMSRFDAATGRLLTRWFGASGYAAMTFPDPVDPTWVYYVLEPEGFARAHIPNVGGVGTPDAVWVMSKAGFPDVGSLIDQIAAPVFFTGNNNKKYLVSDTNPHGICLVEGDKITPIGYARVADSKEKPSLELWSDTNGDGKVQPNELTTLTTVGGKAIAPLATLTGSMWMAPNGDLYLVTEANSILKVPVAATDGHGVVRWNTAKASYVVPQVLDKAGDHLFTGWRTGILGVRTDSKGNLFTCLNATVPYATPELTSAMKEGLGHSAESNTVKFAKFSPDGKLLWMAGRKATAGARPGEMYHFWVLGGLVSDNYVAGCSEWGQIYFYTADGFFVDALMNDPATGPTPGPYTFGGETFGSRVKYFPHLDQVWAYQSGRTYQVKGFKKGVVEGETRLSGRVTLDKTYDLATAPAPNSGTIDNTKRVPAP